MAGTDLTSVLTGEGVAAIFVAVDHGATACVGRPPGDRRTGPQPRSTAALEPARQGVRERFGAFAGGIARGLRLRHDRGGRYVAHAFRAEIRFLGSGSSPALVPEPAGNGGAARFIRKLTENLLWMRRFATVEELRQALLEFRRCYTATWIVERHGYRTPARVGADQLGALATAASASTRCLKAVDRYRRKPAAREGSRVGAGRAT